MKKLIVATLAVILFLCACAGGGSAQGSEAEELVFDLIQVNGYGNIIRHNKTGVCYLLYTGRSGEGLTLMVNPDGSPYVWEEGHED